MALPHFRSTDLSTGRMSRPKEANTTPASTESCKLRRTQLQSFGSHEVTPPSLLCHVQVLTVQPCRRLHRSGLHTRRNRSERLALPVRLQPCSGLVLQIFESPPWSPKA